MTHGAVLDDRLSELIGRVYDAAMDGDLWAGVAPKIAEAFESSSAVLKLHDGPEVHLLECTQNMIVPESRREWAEYWHRRDLWVERTVAFGLSIIVTDQDLVSPEEQRKSGFYQEWLRELDIFHLVGTAFSTGDGAIGVLGVHRPEQAQDYSRVDRHRAALFLPHLQRALEVGQRLASVGQAAALDTLDRLDTGVLVVTRTRRVVHANRLAEEILRAAPEIGARDGQVFLQDVALQERFAYMVRSCVETAGGRPEPPEGALCVPRVGRLPLMLAVAPLRPRELLAGSRPFALVFLRDPDHPSLEARCLRDLFGLTRTEAAIASDLGAGRSLERIARRRGIGLATVRSHLKQILAKTGTNRQAEAAALLAHSVASLRLDHR
jgi:DNA-binding CsgD family transcriptional regulator